VYRCDDVANGYDVVNIMIVYGFAHLNECVGFECVCMFELMCLNEYLDVCRFCNSSCAGYSIFYNFLN
jgi:hypothetical protein